MAPVEYDGGLDAYQLFETYALINPRMVGSQHPDQPHLWTFETPAALSRLPHLVFVYTIEDDDGYVTLWNVYRV